MIKTRLLLQLGLIAVLAACTHANVETTQSYLGPTMARPAHIYVTYFSTEPDQVRLDQGVGARIMRLGGSDAQGVPETKAAQETQAALAEQLVERLVKYGLPAELATDTVGARSGVLLQGQITSIDEGNRTRRLLIGLGAGKSSIKADAQLYDLNGTAPPRFMMAFEGQADSGRAPGAAETMGAGAVGQRMATSAVLTGASHGSAETRRTGYAAQAGQLADKLALRIGQFAVAQGWIPQAALK